MSKEFEEFKRSIGENNSRESVVRKKHQCPHCSEPLSEAYIDQNPFPEIPCPSCGSLIEINSLKESPVKSKNERADIRCNVSLKVTYQSFNRFIMEYTKNVSRGGMFLKTKTQHKLGTKVELFLHVPGFNEPIKITGEVVHAHFLNVKDEEAGIGIKFLDINETSRHILINFVRSLEDCR